MTFEELINAITCYYLKLEEGMAAMVLNWLISQRVHAKIEMAAKKKE